MALEFCPEMLVHVLCSCLKPHGPSCKGGDFSPRVGVLGTLSWGGTGHGGRPPCLGSVLEEAGRRDQRDMAHSEIPPHVS